MADVSSGARPEREGFGFDDRAEQARTRSPSFSIASEVAGCTTLTLSAALRLVAERAPPPLDLARRTLPPSPASAAPAPDPELPRPPRHGCRHRHRGAPAHCSSFTSGATAADELVDRLRTQGFVRRILAHSDQQCSLFLQQRVRSTTQEKRQELFDAVGRHVLELSMSKFGASSRPFLRSCTESGVSASRRANKTGTDARSSCRQLPRLTLPRGGRLGARTGVRGRARRSLPPAQPRLVRVPRRAEAPRLWRLDDQGQGHRRVRPSCSRSDLLLLATST